MMGTACRGPWGDIRKVLSRPPQSQHQLDGFPPPARWRRRTRPSPSRSWRRPRFLSERTGEGFIMTDDTRDFWHSGKVTRRRVIGYGVSAGALGAAMLVPPPWQAAFGQ